MQPRHVMRQRVRVSSWATMQRLSDSSIYTWLFHEVYICCRTDQYSAVSLGQTLQQSRADVCHRSEAELIQTLTLVYRDRPSENVIRRAHPTSRRRHKPAWIHDAQRDHLSGLVKTTRKSSMIGLVCAARCAVGGFTQKRNASSFADCADRFRCEVSIGRATEKPLKDRGHAVGEREARAT